MEDIEHARASNVDYDALYAALEKAAYGEEQSSTSITETTDEHGDKKTVKQIAKKSAVPNINLMMKLLEDRIGGPQDYC